MIFERPTDQYNSINVNIQTHRVIIFVFTYRGYPLLSEQRRLQLILKVYDDNFIRATYQGIRLKRVQTLVILQNTTRKEQLSSTKTSLSILAAV